MIDAAVPRRRMTEDLAANGALTEPWRAAFLAVPRHAFLPAVVWRHDPASAARHDLVPCHQDDDPDAWLEMAYRDIAVVTQVDDGIPGGENLTGYEITSSMSMPTVVAGMLTALAAEPGMTVLEIGTGTGYNAALLAHRLGAEQVISIEVDPVVAEQARAALAAAGHPDVTVITGDGALGYPPRAPFDRVLSTAAVITVPYPWVAQTRPGGRIVTPWGTSYYNGNLLALTVREDGCAVGGIVGEASFMRLREQRIPRFRTHCVVADQPARMTSCTDLHPYHVAGDRHAATAIGLRVPRCQFVWAPSDEGGDLWLVDQWTGSWARLCLTRSGPHAVHQAGDRMLWDEVEAAYQWWVAAGKPCAEQWRFTVDSSGQHVELPA